MMPEIRVTNDTNKAVARANKTFPANTTKVVYVREGKLAEVNGCKRLDWEYANPLYGITEEEIDNKNSSDLKEMAREVGIKNYSTLLKDQLVKKLKVEAGFIDEEEIEEGNDEEEQKEGPEEEGE